MPIPMLDEFPCWDSLVRRDGVSVQNAIDRWIVVAPHRPSLQSCPCCYRMIASERAAKRVADAMYPMAEGL